MSPISWLDSWIPSLSWTRELPCRLRFKMLVVLLAKSSQQALLQKFPTYFFSFLYTI